MEGGRGGGRAWKGAQILDVSTASSSPVGEKNWKPLLPEGEEDPTEIGASRSTSDEACKPQEVAVAREGTTAAMKALGNCATVEAEEQEAGLLG